MQTLEELLTEIRNQGTLYVFDIDDTLLHTNAMTYVRFNGEIVHRLSAQEFNNHVLDDGHEYDFHEFEDAQKFHDESKPIEPVMQLLKTLVASVDGRSKIIMNTARGDFDDKDVVLNTFRKYGIDMDKVHLHRAGNIPGKVLPAMKKLVYIRKYLNVQTYKEVCMFDDSKTNLHHFMTLAREFPLTKFSPWLVSENGRLTKYAV